MRPPAAVAAIALATLVFASCGGDDDDAASTVTTTVDPTAPTAAATSTVVDDTASSSPPASTVPASVPAVEVPAETPTELVVTVITPGIGPKAAEGDSLFVNYVGVRSEDGTEFDNNYGGSPFPVTLGAGGVIPGWEQGLEGAQGGERLQLDIPAELAYGDQPPGEPIQPGDALSFVIDVAVVVPKVDPADGPTAAEVPVSTEPATEVAVEDLTAGDGAALEAGMTGVVHLAAAQGDTGELLRSTWEGGQPQLVVLSPDQLLEGLVEGLEGMQVGGRRAVTIPFASLNEQVVADLGLPADTDLVVVVDLAAVL
jgi:FKBP-type peptidyl-prolyl cis-trans isomerase